jgi:hypothetical protein
MSRGGIVKAVLALSVVPVAAFASHGKTGLWEVTNHLNMTGMMAQIPPDQMARMRAMGAQLPNGRAITTQYCVTEAQVADDKPPPLHNIKDCSFSNMKYDPHNFSADMTCAGEMQGQGHISFTYDGSEHYSGTYAFNGSAHGHVTSMTNSLEGKWLSADCGSMK